MQLNTSYASLLDLSIMLCLYCDSPNEFDNQMDVCSQCKEATYCCRDCQRQHWKAHKGRCSQVVKERNYAYEGGQKQVYRFMQSWIDQLYKNGGSLMRNLLLATFEYSFLESLSENDKFVRFLVSFDYNKRTFLPAEPMRAECISTITGASIQRSIDMRMTIYENACEEDNDASLVLLFLECKYCDALSTVIPCLIQKPKRSMPKEERVLAVMEFGIVSLTSSKFAMWDEQMQANVKKQLMSLSKEPQYAPFLVNALRIESKPKTQRHKSHVIVVTMNMGYGLGEIESLGEYQVRPVGEVIANLEWSLKVSARDRSSTTREAIKAFVTENLDLENSPLLLHSRQAHPHNYMLPVVFLAPLITYYILPFMMEVLPGHFCHKAAKCDKKARHCYTQLCQAKLPAVESPSLS